MQKISKFFRNIFRDLKFKYNSVYRGQGYSAFQALMAYNKKQKDRDKVTLKYHEYPELNQYFLQFLNSAETSGRVNGDNLAFLIGAENIGKTNYVQSNIERFKQIKNEIKDKSKRIPLPTLHIFKSPEYVQNQIKESIFQNQHFIILNFNFKNNPCLNYSGFLRQIHETIITQIINLNKRLDNRLLNAQIIKQIFIAQNSQEYLYVYLKDVIYCIIDDRDLMLLSKYAKEQLNELNQQIIENNIEASQFFSDQKLYGRVVKIIGQDLKITEAQAAIRLFFSVAKRIQYEHRPSQHINGWYQTGIQSTNFLFDILNFMNGFGKLQKQIFEQYFIKKIQLSPFKQNLIKNFIRIDIGMFFLNMDNLYFYGSAEYWNFIDHIISRTSNMSGLRTHFPVMIQFSNYADFEEVHDMGQFNYGTPVVIQLPGYKLMQFLLSATNVSQVFTPKILSSLFFRLGRNPQTWNKAIVQIAKGKTTMKEIITGKSQYLLKENIRVEAKINSIFTHNEIIPQLNDDSARFQLVQHLRLLKKGNGVIILDRPGYYIDFYTRPIWRSLMKQKLIYMHYYSPYVDVANLTDLIPLIQIKNQILKGNILRFLSWRYKNIGILRLYGRQIQVRLNFEKQSHNYNLVTKIRKQGQLRQTYYGANHNYMFHYKQRGVYTSPM